MHKNLKNIPVAIICLSAVFSCASPRKYAQPPLQRIDHNTIIAKIRNAHHRATVVNVWASWCEPCRKEMPGLVRLQHRYADKDVEVILVSTDDSATAETVVPRLLDSLGVDFQTYLDSDSTDEEFIAGMNPDWSGALPASFIYNRDGRVVDMLVGGKSYETFEEAVTKLLKDE